MFFKSDFLTKIKTSICTKITKVEYKIGSTWRTCTITSKQVESGNIVIKAQCDSVPSGNQTINGIRIIADDGSVAGESTENISKTSTQGIFIKIEIPLVEKEV